MQIKFLTMYHMFKDEEYSKAFAQQSLLSMWQKSISDQNIKYIDKAHLIFQAYSFSDYPDQERLHKELNTAYGRCVKKNDPIEYWWAGEQYPDFDTLYKALAKQKLLMELVIIVEDL